MDGEIVAYDKIDKKILSFNEITLKKKSNEVDIVYIFMKSNFIKIS